MTKANDKILTHCFDTKIQYTIIRMAVSGEVICCGEACRCSSSPRTPQDTECYYTICVQVCDSTVEQ